MDLLRHAGQRSPLRAAERRQGWGEAIEDHRRKRQPDHPPFAAAYHMHSVPSVESGFLSFSPYPPYDTAGARRERRSSYVDGTYARASAANLDHYRDILAQEAARSADTLADVIERVR